MEDQTLTVLILRVLAAIFSVILAVASNTCQAPKSSTEPVPAPSPASNEFQAGRPGLSKDYAVRLATYFSEETGLPNLRDVKLPQGQSELRICKGGGLFYVRCFILKVKNDHPSATSLDAKTAKVRGSVRYRWVALKEPHSGWNSLFTSFREAGIESGIALKFDSKSYPDPDEEALLIEMKNGPDHAIVSYLESTESTDGQRAFTLCRNIQKEFAIRLC